MRPEKGEEERPDPVLVGWETANALREAEAIASGPGGKPAKAMNRVEEIREDLERKLAEYEGREVPSDDR